MAFSHIYIMCFPHVHSPLPLFVPPPHSCWLPHSSQLVISHFLAFCDDPLNFIRVSYRALGEGLLSGVWAPYR